MFKPEQIRALLAVAGPNMTAMILLAINGGLGNTDLAQLPAGIIDAKSGWLDYPRAKTAMPRRIPLWKETVEALKVVLDQRPQEKTLLFIGPRGVDYTGHNKGYRVHQEFVRTMKEAGVAGRTFYDLRRTFQTIGEGVNDLVAVRSIMGHAPASGDMSAVYRQQVGDERLRAVADHVRGWLYGKPVRKRKAK